MHVGIVDCARDPLKKFQSEIYKDVVPCLRCKLTTLWILPTPATTHLYGDRGRLLSLQERTLLYGICPEMVQDLSLPALTKALGNCIATPTMTLILAPLLRPWIEMRKLATND